ncbi:protein NRT1/ PTR FAMILY 1.2-like [Olea europaea var. sylvestris]|uniref:protein NRT1/ PTR FAMILY 1.2-like n=1 Tax=Olea europaea var. sylvestris TaxID=158386 RepID=UPI000C1D2B26|nr:protein NRT1/ PTR FAMILY 1.2-like [Olea europaea var. sylvestris]
MKNSWDHKKTMMEEPLLESTQKGGLRALPFIIANEAFEKMATYGLMPNMILYLMKQYHMEMTTASNIMFFWSGATNFMPVLGAIISDSFLGRFRTIGFGSIVCLMGMILLWSTTIFPQTRPPPCDESSETCIPPTIFQSLFLCTSLGLMSIGAGGIRSSSLAFGADQLESRDGRKNMAVMESYFSWYYASYTLSVLIAVTCVVYIQDNMGWKVGFAVPAVLMFFSAVSFFLASSFYVKLKCKSSLVVGFIQVITASYRRRHLKLSANCTDVVYHCKEGSALVFPSDSLRFLNKACIVKNPEKDLTPDGNSADSWNLCTVDQIEELKSLIRVVPIWSTGMIMSINICQNSFPVLQATSMNRNIGSGFKIPAGSFVMFTVISIILWIALYDRVFLPMASRIMRKRIYISTLNRMGAGIFLSFMAMVVTAVVENIRRSFAVREGCEDKPQAVVHLSAMWLVPQYCLSGFAEALNAIAQNEFYFSEFPRSMSSIASTLNGLGMSAANLLASFILSSIDDLTKRGGNESWISSNINKGHYDYYYLVLAGLSMANLIYFLLCRRAYGPRKEEREQPGNMTVS